MSLRRFFVCACVMIVGGRLSLGCVGDDPSVTGGNDAGALPRDGEEGGRCFGNQTCLHPELTCASGLCVRLEAGVGTSDAGDASTDTTDAANDAPVGPTCDAGPIPNAASGPRCPGTPCAHGNVCCTTLNSSAPHCVLEHVDGGEICNPERPIRRCENRGQCANNQACCLRFASPSTACDYRLAETSCKSSCDEGELELCSANVPSCNGGKTCKAVRITTPEGTSVAGACR